MESILSCSVISFGFKLKGFFVGSCSCHESRGASSYTFGLLNTEFVLNLLELFFYVLNSVILMLQAIIELLNVRSHFLLDLFIDLSLLLHLPLKSVSNRTSSFVFTHCLTPRNARQSVLFRIFAASVCTSVEVIVSRYH